MSVIIILSFIGNNMSVIILSFIGNYMLVIIILSFISYNVNNYQLIIYRQ